MSTGFITFLILVTVLAVYLTIYYYIEKRRIKKLCRMSFWESMQLTELPIITMYNDCAQLNFLLDTGSNKSYINKRELKQIQYKTDKETISTFGFEGNIVEELKTCTFNISYKDNEFTGKFVICDLDAAFDKIKTENGVKIHGILGSDFLEKYKYVIDFSSYVAYIK